MQPRRVDEGYALPPVFRDGPPAWRSRRGPVGGSVANARIAVASGQVGCLRLWIMSDLGVDREDDAFTLPDAPPRFDAMLVAGNVAKGMTASLEWLGSLRGRLSGRPVILVPGPGDYATGMPPSETLRLAREAGETLGIDVLADGILSLPDGTGAAVHVIGATLWTDWALDGAFQASAARAHARHRWSGADGITTEDGRPWGPHDAAGAHARSRAYIEDVLGSAACQRHGLGTSPTALVAGIGPRDRVVVATHHAPSPFSLAADWEGWIGAPGHAASIATDLGDVMESWGAPSLWVHGCVPAAVDYRLGKTRVVSNPRPRGCGTFDPGLIVEV